LELTILKTSQNGRNLYTDGSDNLFLDCMLCNSKLPIQFFSTGSGVLGRKGRCRKCLQGTRKSDFSKIKTNKETERFKSKMKKHRRKARLLGLPSTLSSKQAYAILEKYNFKCALTGIPFPNIDHIIPTAIGGGTIIENILPLASHVNSYKRDLNIFEWAIEYYERLGFTLERFYEVMTEVACREGMTLEEYREYVNWCFDNTDELITATV
jgi:5-methylcytosine-specific restriction endonuclease McrA